MEPKDFYELAGELVVRKDEASTRTAVSRAYYAALNHAARIVERMGAKLPNNWEIHDFVADKLVDLEPGLKHELGNLKIERGKADYRVWEPWLSTDVAEILEDAKHVIELINEKTQT